MSVETGPLRVPLRVPLGTGASYPWSSGRKSERVQTLRARLIAATRRRAKP